MAGLASALGTPGQEISPPAHRRVLATRESSSTREPTMLFMVSPSSRIYADPGCRVGSHRDNHRNIVECEVSKYGRRPHKPEFSADGDAQAVAGPRSGDHSPAGPVAARLLLDRARRPVDAQASSRARACCATIALTAVTVSGIQGPTVPGAVRPRRGLRHLMAGVVPGLRRSFRADEELGRGRGKRDAGLGDPIPRTRWPRRGVE